MRTSIFIPTPICTFSGRSEGAHSVSVLFVAEASPYSFQPEFDLYRKSTSLVLQSMQTTVAA